jgi:hypothetical protein
MLALAASLLIGSLNAQVVNSSADEAEKEAELVSLSPFEVKSERARGYISPNSVGATKVNTPLSDIPIWLLPSSCC